LAFADRCQRSGWDISRDTVAKIEAQSRWVADFEMTFLANVLHVTPDQLLPPQHLLAKVARGFVARLETEIE
jgi:hypothetical protein